MAQHLPTHLLLFILCMVVGTKLHSLVIEVICAEVVKEFIHDLVVIHDLHNPFLQGQVVMKDICVPGGWR